MPRKYLHVFTDRHGKKRIYFRRAGHQPIPLPPDMESPEFHKSYEKALRATTAVKGPTPKQIERMREWSGRRLASAVTDTMEDVGVYLLMKAGRVVYVGTSRNCAQRIKDHRTTHRPFDKAFYIYAEDSERLALERALIRQLQPEQNAVGALPKALRDAEEGVPLVNPSQPGQ